MYLTNGVIGSAMCQAEVRKPETVIERIQDRIDKVNQYDANEELHRRISRIENETQMAIVGLCEEIEQLKTELKNLRNGIFNK